MSQSSSLAESASGASSITATGTSRKRGRPTTANPLAKFSPKALEWCFTFNNYSEQDPSKLSDLFASIGASFVFQREIADSGTPHLQGVVRFRQPIQTLLEFPKFDENYKKIHWEVCRSWEHAIRYCSKEDTRVPDTVPFSNVEVLPIPNIYGWQTELVDDLLPSFRCRNVYWFYEPTGGVGKSMLVRYLCMTQKALLVSGKDADIKHGVAAWFESAGTGPELVIIDVPRSSVGYISYAGIEQVANGCFFSSKYESKMIVTKQPIILCFANERPNFERMSRDRWQVYLVDHSIQKCVMQTF